MKGYARYGTSRMVKTLAGMIWSSSGGRPGGMPESAAPRPFALLDDGLTEEEAAPGSFEPEGTTAGFGVTTSVNYAPRFKPGCSEMVEIVRWGPNAHTGRPFGRPNHFQTTG